MRLAPVQRVTLAVLALLLGWSLPLMGVSLLLFLLVDVIRYARHQRAAA